MTTTCDFQHLDDCSCSTKLDAAPGPIEALMPDGSSQPRHRFSVLSSTVLVLGATVVVALYIGLPLVLAASRSVASLGVAVLVGAAVLVALTVIVLMILRRSAHSRTAGPHLANTPARHHEHVVA